MAEFRGVRAESYTRRLSALGAASTTTSGLPPSTRRQNILQKYVVTPVRFLAASTKIVTEGEEPTLHTLSKKE